jgi:phosphate transport system substrate-binding protein
MAAKNETRILLLSLAITVTLITIVWSLLRGMFTVSQSPKQVAAPPAQQAAIDVDIGVRASPSLTFTQVRNVPSGIFNYGGSTTWAPIRDSVDLAIQKARPEFRLNYVQQEGVAPSSQSGLDLLAQGKVAFSLSSRLPSTLTMQDLEEDGVQVKLVPVADSFEAIAVHPSLPISQITIDQWNAISDGRITNWNELGGPDLVIERLDRLVNASFLDTRPDLDKPNTQIFTTPIEAIRRLANTSGGIYSHTAPLIVPQCTIKPLAIVNAVGQTVPPYQEPLVEVAQCPSRRNRVNMAAFASGAYPEELRNTLYVVINQNGQVEQQAGEAYANFLLSHEGQTLLEQAGYLRIR